MDWAGMLVKKGWEGERGSEEVDLVLSRRFFDFLRK